MPLTMIKGTFRVVGASPDGDSVRFYPDNPDAFTISRIPARTNAHGGAQLRLDGIDALEIHYTPTGSRTRWRQPVALADAASTSLLTQLGFVSVQRDAADVVTAADPVETHGHILTRFADKYGRPVCFVHSGDRARTPDLGQVYLQPAGLRRSVNWQQLRAGLAYPTYYSKLFVDLRDELTAAVAEARAEGAGIWEHDVTGAGFRLESRQQLQDELVIVPKLFRRLAEYLDLDATGGVSLARFPQFLQTLDDRLFTVPDGHATSYDTLVQVRRQRVRVSVPPEQIVFQEK
jgi:endonuclease YncB( thermonuclease family)